MEKHVLDNVLESGQLCKTSCLSMSEGLGDGFAHEQEEPADGATLLWCCRQVIFKREDNGHALVHLNTCKQAHSLHSPTSCLILNGI